VKVMHDRVAAIDVHKDMVKVAVRVPGERRGTRKTDVLEFRTFYGVLEEMGRELRRRGVTHVVMEASGVYTEPVYYALAGLDFTEVMVINPAHAKALKVLLAGCCRVGVLTVNGSWLSRCRGVQVGGGKGLPLEHRVPVVELISASFGWARRGYVPGRWADRQRMILTGQSGECGCYLGEARSDVRRHGLSSAAVVLMPGVGLGGGEPEVALTGREQCSNPANRPARRTDGCGICPRRCAFRLYLLHHAGIRCNGTGCIIVRLDASG
jgi:hypothetical protein